MVHRVYQAIVKAVRSRALREPFSNRDFQDVCPGFGAGTYQAFLHKHSKNNPGRNSELFERVGPGQFKCIRPFKYDL